MHAPWASASKQCTFKCSAHGKYLCDMSVWLCVVCVWIQFGTHCLLFGAQGPFRCDHGLDHAIARQTSRQIDHVRWAHNKYTLLLLHAIFVHLKTSLLILFLGWQLTGKRDAMYLIWFTSPREIACYTNSVTKQQWSIAFACGNRFVRSTVVYVELHCSGPSIYLVRS